MLIKATHDNERFRYLMVETPAKIPADYTPQVAAIPTRTLIAQCLTQTRIDNLAKFAR